MKAVFMGTGTSVGIPVIGCNCDVCRSGDVRNRRRRASLYIEASGRHIVVDTPPDFREQALEYRIPRVDAVLFTHSHADHIFGFDDIRRFNTIQDCMIPAYGSAATVADLRRVFSYVQSGERMPGEAYRPRVEFREVSDPFDLGPIRVRPLSVIHDPNPTLGYLFTVEGRTLGYVPDCRRMTDETMEALRGVDVMILDALRHDPHATHLHLRESVRLLTHICARRSYLIHMCHDLDHNETERALPDSIRVSYDGLTLDW